MQKSRIPKTLKPYYAEVCQLSAGTFFEEASLRRSRGMCRCIWQVLGVTSDKASAHVKVHIRCERCLKECPAASLYWGMAFDERVLVRRDIE